MDWDGPSGGAIQGNGSKVAAASLSDMVERERDCSGSDQNDLSHCGRDNRLYKIVNLVGMSSSPVLKVILADLARLLRSWLESCHDRSGS